MTKISQAMQWDRELDPDQQRAAREMYQARLAGEADLRHQVGGAEGAEEIVGRINRYIAAGVGVSRITAECESGFKRSQLETMLSEKPLDSTRVYGQWWDDPETMSHLIALKKWADEEDAADLGREDHAETPIFKQVYGICTMAMKSRGLYAITGMYGIGKTFAARRFAFDYARRPNEAGAVYFDFSPGAKGDAGVLEAVLEALDPHGLIKGNVQAKLNRILSLVRPGDFIIADECGIPAQRGTGLRFMSYINERAGIPVLMIGNPEFHGEVWGKRHEYDALASRTRHIALGTNSAEDVEAFMDWRRLGGKGWREAMLTVAKLPGRDGGIRALDRCLDELVSRGIDLTPVNFVEMAKTYGRWAA